MLVRLAGGGSSVLKTLVSGPVRPGAVGELNMSNVNLIEKTLLCMWPTNRPTNRPKGPNNQEEAAEIDDQMGRMIKVLRRSSSYKL